MNEVTVEVPALLKRTNVLLSVLAKAQLKPVLEAELADAKKKKLYELTDGTATVRDLSEKVAMSIGSISRTWQYWEDCGLVFKEDGKYKRTFD